MGTRGFLTREVGIDLEDEAYTTIVLHRKRSDQHPQCQNNTGSTVVQECVNWEQAEGGDSRPGTGHILRACGDLAVCMVVEEKRLDAGQSLGLQDSAHSQPLYLSLHLTLSFVFFLPLLVSFLRLLRLRSQTMLPFMLFPQ